MKKICIIAGTSWLLIGSLQGMAANLDHCREVTVALERLACYDEAAGPSTPDLSEEAVTANELEPVVAEIAEQSDSPLSDRLARQADMNDSPFAIVAHRRNYLLPVTYNSKTNVDPFEALYPGVEMDDIEAKFQISFKALLVEDFIGGQLWGGYTQTNWWQVYNSEESAPFRETNYQPEAMMVWDNDWKLGGLTNTKLSFGLNHQSNGRGEGLSRSWNRIIAGAAFEKRNFALVARAWYRIPEDDDDDNNPNMDDYYGHGDINLAYKLDDMELAATIRNNLKGGGDNKGSIELEWTKPVNKRFKWYVQYFYGYGESMIDYNVKTNRIGIGFALNNIL